MLTQSVNIIVFFYFFCSAAIGQLDYGFEFTKAGMSGLQFLKIDVGGKESGMGGAVSTVVRDANAVFWNPAGIADSKGLNIIFTRNDWLVNSEISTMSLSYSFNFASFALSVLSYQIEKFEETTVLKPTGTGYMVNAGDLLIGVAVSRKFTDKLNIGGQVKYVQETLDAFSYDNILFDLGSSYATGYRDLKLAFVLQHFGPDITPVYRKFKPPLLFKIGASDNIYRWGPQKLLVSLDVIHPTDNNEWVSVGTEYSLYDKLFMRWGYRFNRDLGDMAFGFGVESIKLGSTTIFIDYSYMDYGEIFNEIQRLTVGIRFN